ncbi:hypothetical protein B0H67DRAFT_608332, partial [Lasiosphaeris hirsuta]
MIGEAFSNAAADGHVPTAMAMAKRKASDDDGDVPITMAKWSANHTNGPLQLTRKNVALFNTLNGDAEDSNYDSAYLFEEDDDGDTMKKISTTNSSFEQRAYENGILDPVASHPPQDLDNIQYCLTQRRTSTQPSEGAHQRYCNKVFKSDNEAEVSSLIQSKIIKEYNDMQYGKAVSRAITRIPSQDFNNGLSNPLPDILEGLDTAVLPNGLHDDHALHKTNSLSLCHFAAEIKRTDGNLHQATVQAAHDGAVLVNARERALSQARANLSNHVAIDKAAEEAAVFTCVTDGTVAEVYTHNSKGGQYHQNLVAHFARSKSYELANLLGADLKEEE